MKRIAAVNLWAILPASLIAIVAAFMFRCVPPAPVSPPMHLDIPTHPEPAREEGYMASVPGGNVLSIGTAQTVNNFQGGPGLLTDAQRAVLYSDMHRLNEYLTRRK
jgi:hypothetical protein